MVVSLIMRKNNEFNSGATFKFCDGNLVTLHRKTNNIIYNLIDGKAFRLYNGLYKRTQR